MDTPSTRTRPAEPIAALAATLWAGWAAWRLWAQVSAHTTRLIDFLPLWLGGRALLFRLDPTDPAVHEQLFRAAALGSQPGGFQSYYPQSAALVFAPLGYLPYPALARPLQAVMLASWLACGALAANAAPGRSPVQRWLLAALGAATMASLQIGWVMINIGQSNTLLIGLAAVGLWSLAARSRRAETIGGVAIGLGVAIKLFPGVLLVAALLARRWRTVALGVGIPAALLLASLLLYAGPWAHPPLGGAGRFLSNPTNPGWAAVEPGWISAMVSARVAIPGALVAAATLWAARRPAEALWAPLGALWLAWVGVVMAGGSMPHQVITGLPALCWLLSTARRPAGALAAALVAAALVWRGVLSEHIVGSPQWLPVAWTVVLGCGVGFVDAAFKTNRHREA